MKAAVLGSCIIPFGRFRPATGSEAAFPAYWHGWFIFSDKAPSIYPADQMTLTATYLFMLNGYFCDTFLPGLQTKALHSEGKGKFFLSGHFINKAEPVPWLVKMLPSTLMSAWSIWGCCSIWMITKTAQLVNIAVPECATLKRNCTIALANQTKEDLQLVPSLISLQISAHCKPCDKQRCWPKSQSPKKSFSLVSVSGDGCWIWVPR